MSFSMSLARSYGPRRPRFRWDLVFPADIADGDFTGDEEFFLYLADTGEAIDKDAHYTWGDEPEHAFRPLDFSAAHAWIDEYIVEGNRPRLHRILDHLHQEPDLWLHGSW